LAKRGKLEGKTAFVREMLQKDSHANPKSVNDAWKAAGKKGTISTSLVTKSRAALGLTGNLRSGPTAQPAAAKAPAPPTAKPPALKLHTEGASAGKRGDSLQLEAAIDRLLFKVIEEGGMSDVEEALRLARRRLIVGHHR
jgi:hypothetical protein